MGYWMANGKWSGTDEVTLAASAARTATGTGSSYEAGGRGLARCIVTVSAASGTTPTLIVKLQGSTDGSTWFDIDGASTGELTTTGTAKFATATWRYVRPAWTIGGTTPSFTFTVEAEFTG